MLRSLKELEGYSISATDGDLGRVENFLLDDECWTVRYLIAAPGGFLGGKRVLISPLSFGHADWVARRFHVSLTMDRVRNSPSVDTEKPVSRQQERDYDRYFGYSSYWGSVGPWGEGPSPAWLAAKSWVEPVLDPADAGADVHLRSASEVRGYHIQGRDAEIGHVNDFAIDDETWEVRYLVVDTSNWWLGKKVLVAPQWATRVSGEREKVYVDLTRQSIKDCPAWNAADAINREYEARLYAYYQRPAYWDTSGRAVMAQRRDLAPTLPG